ncbi:phage tail assembly chaperone [Brevundimonas sp.]|uniref:phage tail assembly chaperone n=1 Tax=Brevundimonas sp. TaxID=1871086 RepID=UPI003D099CCA
MLRTGVSLGVEPEAFWRLSLAEWRMLTEVAPGAAPMGRSEFERLMAAWPDGGET